MDFTIGHTKDDLIAGNRPKTKEADRKAVEDARVAAEEKKEAARKAAEEKKAEAARKAEEARLAEIDKRLKTPPPTGKTVPLKLVPAPRGIKGS